MITPRVTRALNPQKRRRNLSIKQIKAGFGGKRRLASLRASNKHVHKARKKSNPKKAKRRATAKAKNATKTRIVYRTKYKTRTKNVYVAPPKRKRKANPKRKRRSNPGPYLLTMAPVLGNPQKKRRKANMAKAKRRVSAAGRSGKRNPTRRAANRRKHHRRSHHRVHHRRRRNPALLPQGSPMAWVQKGFGVFIGFSAAKKFPPMLGPSMNSSPYMTLLATLVTASLTSFVAHKFAPPAFAEGVMWGGLGGAFNMAWNTWAPATVTGYWPGVSGVGDFVPGGFPLPQGPVRYALSASPMEAPNGSQVNVGAFGRAW